MFSMAFDRDVDFYDACPISTYLDLESGGAEKFHITELPVRGGPFEALEKLFGGAEADLDLAVLKRVPELRKLLLRIATYRRIAVDKITMLNPELDAFMQPAGGAAR